MLEHHLTALTQLGAAGLIGLLWILERRHAATRDRQLDEAHQRLLRQNHELDVLLRVVAQNTRAICAMEAAQKRLTEALERMRLALRLRVARRGPGDSVERTAESER